MKSTIIRLYYWGVWAITVLLSSISSADLNAPEVLNEIIELRDDDSGPMAMVKLQIRISEAPLSEQKEFNLLVWEKIKGMPYPLKEVDIEIKPYLIVEQQLAYKYIVNTVAKLIDKKMAFDLIVMAYLERKTPDGLTEFLNTLELNQLYGEHTLPVLLELYNEQVDIRLLYGGNPNGFSCGTCGSGPTLSQLEAFFSRSGKKGVIALHESAGWKKWERMKHDSGPPVDLGAYNAYRSTYIDEYHKCVGNDVSTQFSILWKLNSLKQNENNFGDLSRLEDDLFIQDFLRKEVSPFLQVPQEKISEFELFVLVAAVELITKSNDVYYLDSILKLKNVIDTGEMDFENRSMPNQNEQVWTYTINQLNKFIVEETLPTLKHIRSKQDADELISSGAIEFLE